MTQDMTKGSPWKLILFFTIPALIGNVAQQLYSMVDSIIVGRFVSTNGLAAVGASGPVTFMVIMFTIGLTAGFGVIVSQKFGAGDLDGLKHSVYTGLVLCGVLSVILTIIGVLSVEPLLHFMNTPEEIYSDASLYSKIIFLGSGATVFYNMAAGFVRALGDSKTPLYFLIFSSLLNIVLDLFFILVLHMGVAGAAWATIASQFIAALICIAYAFRHYKELQFRREHTSWDWAFAMKHLEMGMPMAMQGVITGVGIIIFQMALNNFGSTAIAAYTAANKVEILITQAIASLGITMATYCGQNYGAGRMDRIRQGIRTAIIIGMISSFFAGILLVFGGKYSVSIFMSQPSKEAFSYAATYLRISGIWVWTLTLLFIFRNSLQGIGDAMTPLLGGIGELIARVLVVMTLPKILGFVGICYASPLAWVFADIVLIGKYCSMVRRKKVRC